MRRKAARDRRPARGPMCAGARAGRVAACRGAVRYWNGRPRRAPHTPSLLPQCYCFFTPRSARASLALAIEAACLPPSCSFWASSSLATAAFTLGSSAFIVAAASRPSLMIFGQELASATPLVSARLTATAVTVRSFLIWTHPLGTQRNILAVNRGEPAAGPLPPAPPARPPPSPAGGSCQRFSAPTSPRPSARPPAPPPPPPPRRGPRPP